MAKLTRFNLRDKGAEIWAGWSRPVRTIFVVLCIAVVGLLPFAASWGPTSFLNTPITSFQNVLVYPVGMFIMMALGLNIVVGKSGLLDLGYVAFFAIGAYSQGILSTLYGWNTWEVMPVGIGFAMIAGAILGLPALRLRGDYLAIITLGFGEIVRLVAINLSVTGGPNGVVGIPKPTFSIWIPLRFDAPTRFLLAGNCHDSSCDLDDSPIYSPPSWTRVGGHPPR